MPIHGFGALEAPIFRALSGGLLMRVPPFVARSEFYADPWSWRALEVRIFRALLGSLPSRVPQFLARREVYADPCSWRALEVPIFRALSVPQFLARSSPPVSRPRRPLEASKPIEKLRNLGESFVES